MGATTIVGTGAAISIIQLSNGKLVSEWGGKDPAQYPPRLYLDCSNGVDESCFHLWLYHFFLEKSDAREHAFDRPLL